MEVISEEYKMRSEDDGVFGILYEGYIKHEYQVLTILKQANNSFPFLRVGAQTETSCLCPHLWHNHDHHPVHHGAHGRIVSGGENKTRN